MLSVDQPADEENGKVLAGTLAWSGNFRLGFENIKYSEDFGNLLQVLPGINNYASDIHWHQIPLLQHHLLSILIPIPEKDRLPEIFTNGLPIMEFIKVKRINRPC
jgi:hypothetical protein